MVNADECRRHDIIIANQIIEDEPRRGEIIIFPEGRHDCNKTVYSIFSPVGMT